MRGRKGLLLFGSSVPELVGSRFGLGLLLSTSRCPVCVGLFGACCSMWLGDFVYSTPWGEKRGNFETFVNWYCRLRYGPIYDCGLTT